MEVGREPHDAALDVDEGGHRHRDTGQRRALGCHGVDRPAHLGRQSTQGSTGRQAGSVDGLGALVDEAGAEVDGDAGDEVDVELDAEGGDPLPVDRDHRRWSAAATGGDRAQLVHEPAVDQLRDEPRDRRLVQAGRGGHRGARSRPVVVQRAEHEREVVAPDRDLVGGTQRGGRDGDARRPVPNPRDGARPFAVCPAIGPRPGSPRDRIATSPGPLTMDAAHRTALADQSSPGADGPKGYGPSGARDEVRRRDGARRAVTELLLGPILRHVTQRTATIWVETDGPCTVEVLGRRARTFHVAGHHYALVVVDGLEPGARTEYGVDLDGERRWPDPALGLPPSTIATLPDQRDERAPLRILFGSCRIAAPHEPPWSLELALDARGRGVDALRTHAMAHGDAAAGGVARAAGAPRRPGLRRRLVAAREGTDRGPPRLDARTERPPPRARVRLRGVHLALPGVVGLTVGALGALGHAERDDLRRPRHDRRLEHLRHVGRRHPAAGLVDRDTSSVR